MESYRAIRRVLMSNNDVSFSHENVRIFFWEICRHNRGNHKNVDGYRLIFQTEFCISEVTDIACV